MVYDTSPEPLPRPIAWFAPWTWKRGTQMGLIIGLGCIAIMATMINVLMFAYTHHAID